MNFWSLGKSLPLVIHIFCAFELILLVVLVIEILIYADLAKRR
ncbi:hypothetical protein [Dapis sp. BLCC M229]